MELIDGKALATEVRASHILVKTEKEAQDLYDEIKKRSYSYIMEKYLKDLKHELEPYFDISKVQIIFDLKWIYEIDEDYEW